MQWTTEQPTQEGWYWCKWSQQIEPEIVYLMLLGGALRNSDNGYQYVSEMTCEWAGPIPLPEEAPSQASVESQKPPFTRETLAEMESLILKHGTPINDEEFIVALRQARNEHIKERDLEKIREWYEKPITHTCNATIIGPYRVLVEKSLPEGTLMVVPSDAKSLRDVIVVENLGELPRKLEGEIRVGDRFIWEPDKPHARQEIYVAALECRNGEFWVLSSNRNGTWWNEESRFREACVRCTTREPNAS